MNILSAYNINMDDGFSVEMSKGSLIDDVYSSSRFATAVIKGSINVISQIADDRRILITKLKEGDIFGISNLFIDEDLRTMLECNEDCTLFMIRKEAFRKRLIENESAMIMYCQTVNRKIQFLLDKIEKLSVPTARSRIAYSLISGSYMLSRTREELASSLGISRATLFRELSLLQQDGIIEKDGRKLRIKDRRKLLLYSSQYS